MMIIQQVIKVSKERPKAFPVFPDPDLKVPEWVRKEGLPMWNYSKAGLLNIIKIGGNPEAREKLWELDDLFRSVGARVDADAINYQLYGGLQLYVSFNSADNYDEFMRKLTDILSSLAKITGVFTDEHVWVQLITARRIKDDHAH